MERIKVRTRSILQVRGYRGVWAAVTLVSCATSVLAGCGMPPLEAEEPGDDASEVRQQALLGNVSITSPTGGTTRRCSPFFAASFERTADLVGYTLNSAAFRQCVSARMRAQYMDCGDAYTASSIDDAINGVFHALENGNHYRWVCHVDPNYPGIGAHLGDWGTHETKTLWVNAGSGAREDAAEWFAPPSTVWPWNHAVAGAIHEFLHQQGYDHTAETRACALAHGRAETEYYLNNEPSAPYIVDSCAYDVITLSGLLGPIEGSRNGCGSDEVRLVSTWPTGAGPATAGGYQFCETHADCSGGAECHREHAGAHRRGFCGTCETDAHCSRLGASYTCQAGWCRDTRITIPTTCVPNLRRELTMLSIATNQPVRRSMSDGDSAVFLAANAPGRSRSLTSFWLTDGNRGQLLDGDVVHLKSWLDTWVGPSAINVRDDRPMPVDLVIRGASPGPIGPGSWFSLESGGATIEPIVGETPFLRTRVTPTSRRYLRYERTSRRLVYLAAEEWGRWTENVSGAGILKSQYPSSAEPRRDSAFWMIDQNGGTLRNGELVSFETLEGTRFWSTATEGEGFVRLNRISYGWDETFQVSCITCTDPYDIGHGDLVALRAMGTNKYLTHMPRDFYPYQVRAWGEWVGPWQETRIVEVNQYRNPATPLTDVTRPTWKMD